jgi:hypothetical protein
MATRPEHVFVVDSGLRPIPRPTAPAGTWLWPAAEAAEYLASASLCTAVPGAQALPVSDYEVAWVDGHGLPAWRAFPRTGTAPESTDPTTDLLAEARSALAAGGTDPDLVARIDTLLAGGDPEPSWVAVTIHRRSFQTEDGVLWVDCACGFTEVAVDEAAGDVLFAEHLAGKTGFRP